MSRRKRKNSQSSAAGDDMTSRKTTSPATQAAGALPETMVDMTYTTGFTEKTHIHSAASPFSEPSVVFKHVECSIFGKLDAGAATAQAYDPVGESLVSFVLPQLERYLTTAVRSSAVPIPTRVQLATYFGHLEMLYGVICSVRAVRHMATQVDWSSLRRDGLSAPPREIESLARAIGATSPEYEISWGALIDRMAVLPCLPNHLDYMERVLSPFIMDEKDRVVRFPLAFLSDISANFAAAKTTMVTLANSWLNTIESTYIGTINFLRNYIPWVAGIPNTGYVGADPYMAQFWWNLHPGVCELTYDLDDTVTANRLWLLGACLGKRFGAVENWVSGTLVCTKLDESFHFDSFGDQMQVGELMLMHPILATLWNPAGTVRVLNASPIITGSCQFLTAASGGTSFFGMDFVSAGTYMNGPTTASAAKLAVYGNLNAKRYWCPTATVVADADCPYYEGMLHPEMTPCRVASDEFLNIMLRAWASQFDNNVLVKMTQAAAASLPKTMNPAIGELSRS